MIANYLLMYISTSEPSFGTKPFAQSSAFSCPPRTRQCQTLMAVTQAQRKDKVEEGEGSSGVLNAVSWVH